ncbi:MAG: S8 family serine peptidase, partial [Candidatus Micrarchaeota archaeon]
MRKILAVFLVLIFACSAFSVYVKPTAVKNTPGSFDVKSSSVVQDYDLKKGEVIVKFKNTQKADVRALFNTFVSAASTTRATALDTYLKDRRISFGSKVFNRAGKYEASFDKLGLGNVVVLKMSANEDPVEVAKELSLYPEIEYAEPVYLMRLALTPNDPYYASSGAWGQSYLDLYGVHKVQAAAAWDVNQGENVVVAVIDTGVDITHEDLAGSVWINSDEIPNNGVDDDVNGYIDDVNGWDFGDKDKTLTDTIGHGTHCAGTIAGIINNAKGVAGVAPKVKIMPVKGFADNSKGGSPADLAQAIVYAVDNGAQVLSNSWGGAKDSLTEAAVKYALDHGVVVVASAGNSNTEVGNFGPASYPGVIAVAASDWNDQRASFSNWGLRIDVAAPGVNILSLRAIGTDMYGDGTHIIPQGDPNGKYYYASGTSMSGPHAAGVAALVKSLRPNYTPNQVRLVLQQSADDIGATGFDVYTGYGRINALNALQTEVLDLDLVLEPDYASKKINVYAKAGTGTSSWLLEYGKGMAPSSWTSIKSGTNSFAYQLIATFDAKDLLFDYYSFKFTAVDSNGKATSVSQFFDNHYSSVFEFGSAGGGLIGGDIVLSDVNNDGIQEVFAVGGDHKIYGWSGDGKPLAGYPFDPMPWWLQNGCSRVAGAMMDLFPQMGLSIGEIDGDGKKEIAAGFSDVLIVLEAESGALKWAKSPVLSTYLGMKQCPQISRPTLADLNKDGQDEVLVTMGYFQYYMNPAKILEFRAYSGAGNILWSKNLVKTAVSEADRETSLLDFCTQCFYNCPVIPSEVSVADLNNDNDLEVVFSSGTYFYAFSHDGVVLWEKQIPKPPGSSAKGGKLCAAPLIVDLDNDGTQEIVFEDQALTMSVWDFNGNAKWTNRKSSAQGDFWGSFTGRTPSVADFNADGKLEIVQLPHEITTMASHATAFVFTFNGGTY